jgi:hypothetical protein
MSEETVDQNTPGADPRVEVLQAVVDRVTSWQDGATEETVRAELDEALSETDIEVDGETRERIVSRIADGGGAHFDVSELLS